MSDETKPSEDGAQPQAEAPPPSPPPSAPRNETRSRLSEIDEERADDFEEETVTISPGDIAIALRESHPGELAGRYEITHGTFSYAPQKFAHKGDRLQLSDDDARNLLSRGMALPLRLGRPRRKA